MWVLGNCLDLKLCSILCLFFLFGFRFRQFTCQEWVSWHDKESMKLLVYTGFDIVKSTYRLIESVESIRQKHLNKPSFEVGYVMFTVFEKYRKMVDKYNTSIFMGKQLFTMELIMYLEQIENHHWEIEHLTSMLHEIERKYAVTTPLDSKYVEMTSDELKALQAKAKAARLYQVTLTADETKSLRIKQKIVDRMSPTKRSTTKRPYQLDYGWRV